jgi:hypothetical protein
MNLSLATFQECPISLGSNFYLQIKLILSGGTNIVKYAILKQGFIKVGKPLKFFLQQANHRRIDLKPHNGP